MVQMRIPFGTVAVTDITRKLINECLDSGRLSCGRLVRQFEERFAQCVGAKEAVAVSSGTDADILAIAVLYENGAQRGDEVIVPALSFVATGNAVLHAGFTPIFVDVDPRTFNIDVSRIEAAITVRTRAIMPVHLMGKPADMDTINAIARRHHLLVVEDAAEAHGAIYKGRNVGTLGDLAAYSLYVAHIITTGEGGIVVTDNEAYAEVLRSLRAHGRACKCKQCVSNLTSGYCHRRFNNAYGADIRFQFERIGYSSKMNELEAAIGLGALQIYNTILTKRHDNLMRLIDGFQRFGGLFDTFEEAPWERIGPHAFPFIVKEEAPFSREEVMLYLEENGVDARTLFSSIPTQCGGYAFLGHRLGDFPVAEMIGRQGIHIGVHQDVSPEDIQWFIGLMERFIHQVDRRGVARAAVNCKF
ncbi:MAG: DegT/DnrJ/EryC1/StrS family aminotransferase [Desulfatitalea sp.]